MSAFKVVAHRVRGWRVLAPDTIKNLCCTLTRYQEKEISSLLNYLFPVVVKPGVLFIAFIKGAKPPIGV